MLNFLRNLLPNPRRRHSEEFARQIVKRYFIDPVNNPPSGFHSTLPFSQTDLLPRINSIPWFANVGRPVTARISVPYQSLPNWQLAVATCSQEDWDETLDKSSGQLSLWLCKHHRDDYQSWNDVLDQFTHDCITPIVLPALSAYCREHALPPAVSQTARSILLLAHLENHFLPLHHPARFNLELLTLLEAGHFPCGWRGTWPQGELYVY